VDIPFIRFALPALILYLFWNTFVNNPWVDEPLTDMVTSPNYISPNAARELLEQSRALITQGQQEEALNPLLRLHKAYPEDHIYIQELAETYDRLSRFKEGAEMWELYLQYSPTAVEGCPQVGLDYQRQNKPREAFKAFEKCWTIEANADNLFFYAHALEMDGQFQKALGLYQKGLARSPDYPDLVIGLARVQARLGHAAAARPAIEKILNRLPDNVDALLAAGMVYSEIGDTSTALRHLEHARRLSPQNRDVQLVIYRVSRQDASQ
jgi:tetratricopeptide (TPR) repeat protein